MLFANRQLLIANCQLLIASCKLLISSCKLLISTCQLPIPNSRFPSMQCTMPEYGKHRDNNDFFIQQLKTSSIDTATTERNAWVALRLSAFIRSLACEAFPLLLFPREPRRADLMDFDQSYARVKVGHFSMFISDHGTGIARISIQI